MEELPDLCLEIILQDVVNNIPNVPLKFVCKRFNQAYKKLRMRGPSFNRNNTNETLEWIPDGVVSRKYYWRHLIDEVWVYCNEGFMYDPTHIHSNVWSWNFCVTHLLRPGAVLSVGVSNELTNALTLVTDKHPRMPFDFRPISKIISIKLPFSSLILDYPMKCRLDLISSKLEIYSLVENTSNPLYKLSFWVHDSTLSNPFYPCFGLIGCGVKIL